MADPRKDSDGELVVVRQSVLAIVDHASGNLFQRLYHLLRTVRSGSGQALSSLEESVRELQALLELFMDYVTPIAIETRPLATKDLTASFRRHMDDELGLGRVRFMADDGLAATVGVDPGRLARVFQLLSQLLGRAVRVADGLRASCGLSADATYFEITLAHFPPPSEPDWELTWALAEKLVELQGGELRRSVTPDEASWTLRLPILSV